MDQQTEQSFGQLNFQSQLSEIFLQP
jgi:hypothetical protein